MTEPIFIKLLEYGQEIGLKGTDFNAVVKWALENNILPSEENDDFPNQKGLLRDLFFESFTRNSASSKSIWVLKTEYYFRLIEFIELKESRKASAVANRNSIVAACISIAAIVFSLYVGYKQINSSIKIDNIQLKEIIATVKQPVTEAFSIDSSQLKQIIASNKYPVVIDQKQLEEFIQKIKNSNALKSNIEAPTY